MGKVKELSMAIEEAREAGLVEDGDLAEEIERLERRYEALYKKYERLKLKAMARKKCLRSLNRHYSDKTHVINGLMTVIANMEKLNTRSRNNG